MNKNTSWYLKQINLFQGIADEEIMEIAKTMQEKSCHKKEIIYTPHESSELIFVLKKGEVTLYNSHRGKRIIIDVLTPGSIFGNIDFSNEKNSHFAEVTQDSLMCIFPVSEFLKLVQAKPQILIQLLKIMSERLKEYESKLKGGIFDAKEKILHHIAIIKEKNRRSLINKLTGKSTKITHELLSQHTGLSRETVTRAINDLKKEGLRDKDL